MKDYWMGKIKDHPGVSFYTSMKPEFACGLGNFSIRAITPAEIQQKLFSKYKIYTISIDWENIQGVRVTPNVYTTLRELDYFAEAVLEIAGESGI